MCLRETIIYAGKTHTLKGAAHNEPYPEYWSTTLKMGRARVEPLRREKHSDNFTTPLISKETIIDVYHKIVYKL